MSTAAFGLFVALITPPRGIGTCPLDDGALTTGFMSKQCAVSQNRTITE